ncbi:MAG: T9SS type A sorting domain-containing protein [Ignavibacteria bacterium]|nr:T9SS type A sorting domain-containing protein [Ignavibacteria bacterium]MCU7500190.1 T9SS type A sorting domain-containing protein [Ignavibacteria bacterium]MCU7513850.1 T9SS type A sorting domain-containing protein [Ignavibacteria bacterium]MCU7521560.1 T9SS type A sorting domain-containing protein [Ignavibacteria bacterium]MCU7525014.1 T9SS type A sorting domain-containing protein [Ignavibacteria bacterium]
MIKRRRYVIGFSVLIIFLSAFLDVHAQLSKFKAIGSFEDSLPSYWMKGKSTGATLDWATDQSRSMGRSLKITKSAATTDSVYWISQNMADLWSPKLLKNVDILLGAYIRTENVNVNPANDDAKWWVSYLFYDSTGAFIGETKLPIDQSKASSGSWVADTNAVGETTLPKDAWKMIIMFVAGKNATGTVWADDFLFTGRAGAWAGQDWNTSVGVPTGWYYWLPPIGGNDARLSNGFENTKIVSDTAHSGTHSLRFSIPKNTPNHDAFVSTTRIPLGTDVKAGDMLKISVWIKAKDLFPDSANAFPGQWAVGITPMFHTGYTNNAGFSDISGAPDIAFTFPAKDTSFDWTEFTGIYKVPENNPPATALSVRLHVYSLFEGTVYYDDLTVEKLDTTIAGINAIGGFEGTLPSYWMKGKSTGATLDWATDQSRSMGRSLKITKSAATTDSVYWISQNMADLWSPKLLKNVDILLGAYIRTENVNVNPANDDAKWWVSYLFYDSTGAFIGETKLPIDQSKASSGSWVADTNAVGETTLPKDAWKMIIMFVAGKNATGTVWADDFLFTGRAGAWAGQDWNTSVGVPTGWYYWLPPIGGNDARLSNGFENTKIVSDTAHSGTHSLRFSIPKNTPNHDAFVSTIRYPLPQNIKAGDKVTIGVWVKAKDLFPDSANAFPGQWAVGITPMFHTAYTNNAGFSDISGAPDLTFTFPAKDTSFDWRQYVVDVPVPDNNPPAKAISVRLHVYSLFEGTVYFDDLTVQTSTVTAVQKKSIIADNYSLEQNYPNPFNPTTTIRYSIPERSVVTLKIYDMLGREVKTLISTEQNQGVYEVTWNGENNYGTKVSSGIYIYRVEAGRFNQVKKMVLLK